MASPQQHHSRKPSSRAGLPRRATKGPLDEIEGSLYGPKTASPSVPSSRTPPRPQATPSKGVERGKQSALQRESSHFEQTYTVTSNEESVEDERDLSFLLDASVYHSLSQLDVPGPFRRQFLPPPTSEALLADSLEQLDSLLSQCDFLRAAQLAGSILTSGTVKPTDAKTVFRLLAIRYSSLELSGNILLAAQEAKALEDLSSSFYYDNPSSEKGQDDDLVEPRNVSHHVMPFALRLQALRLQSIGFSDPRRGVSTLYDTALECREHLSAPSTSPEERAIWTERLQEVSIRVVNALIEMGDLECAARTLETVKPKEDERLALWTARMVLLRVKIGDIGKARELIESALLGPQEKLALESLLAVAEGRYETTAQTLSECETEVDAALKALLKQNLAVAYLYKGEVRKARQMLQALVDDGHSFQTLTINLATIYDLSSDKSRDLKMAMVSKIASQQKKDSDHLRSFVNADFKL